MNPTEHVWDALGRRVAGRQPPPQTIQELERALLEEWDRIPLINSFIDSMHQRCSTLLAELHNYEAYSVELEGLEGHTRKELRDNSILPKCRTKKTGKVICDVVPSCIKVTVCCSYHSGTSGMILYYITLLHQ
ncbi:transposable element Tcb2 transposase [Trichonephila clavipes]|nr:transposable element Tcb2 transposase [Trichonephila clavipes]